MTSRPVWREFCGNRNNRAWFFLVPVATALLVWGPYWAWNLFHHQMHWWRIPIVSGTIFDTMAYLQWLSQSVNGLDISGHLRWLEWPFQVLARLVSGASVAELWLLSRWISVTATLWVSGWAVRVWSGLDVKRSRYIALAFWLSFVPVLGFRPGVYSWYLPFGIFSMAVPFLVIDRLREQKYRAAVLWTIAAIFTSSVYSWFFVVAVIWLTSIWSVWIISRYRKILFAFLLCAIVVTGCAAPIAAVWLHFSPSGMLLWDLQMRDGVGFTFLPQITNSFFALILWAVFLFMVARSILQHANTDRMQRLVSLQWAWIVLVFSWLITSCTGVYIQNDHFRTPVLIASWLSLAACWSYARESKIRVSRASRWIIWAVLALSIVFILNILRKPYAFDHDYLNVLHLSHWFALAMASWLVLQRGQRAIPFAWPSCILIGSALIGGVAAGVIFQEEYAAMPDRMAYVQTVEWIREHIPETDPACSDPVRAEPLAAFTGRQIFPSSATAISRERIATGLRRMQIYTSGFDIAASGNFEYINLTNYFSRSIICRQFNVQVKLMKAVGVSDSWINTITGCPADFLREMDALTVAMARQPAVDASAFRKMCPWVIISAETKDFWRLPSGYAETPIDGTFSVWHAVP